MTQREGMALLLARFGHWRAVLAPAWKLLVVAPVALGGAMTFVRDEFLSSEYAAKLKILHWLPPWHWYVWVIVFLALVILLVLEGSYQVSGTKPSIPNVSPFTFSPDIYCETRRIRWLDGDEPTYFENTFYLVVGNSLNDARTIAKVQARINFVEASVLSRVKETGKDTADIRHGEWAYFEIGKIVSDKRLGLIVGERTLDAEACKQYKHNVPRGFLSFEIYSAKGDRAYGLSNDAAARWDVSMTVSADNVPSTNVPIRIDINKANAPVTHVVAPAIATGFLTWRSRLRSSRRASPPTRH